MKLSQAQIGYDGYSVDLTGPGDRRRFCAYAAERRVPYERAVRGRDYDLVLVTHNGDIAGWTERKRREGRQLKFVFELVDSYFERRGLGHRLLKGAARSALGIDSRPSLDFLKTLIRACERADAVICSTEEQRETIRRYNPNVVLSFDHFGDDLSPPKADYRRNGKLRLVWEGQSTTLSNIQSLRGVLNEFRDRIQLNVITDPIEFRYLGRFAPRPSTEMLRGIDAEIIFHPWERESFSRQIASGDLVIIPIDLSDPMARAKSASKLIMMWQLGMPVLTSATAAYARMMNDAGIDMVCNNDSAWRHRLEEMIVAEPSALENIGRKCRAYAEHAYSKTEFLARFDSVFESIGFSIDRER